MKPQLVESGTIYFLYETLKQCHLRKKQYYNMAFNISLFLIFLGLMYWFLYHKYTTKKENLESLDEKRKREEMMFIDLVKKVNDEHYQKQCQLITDLPRFENVFENTFGGLGNKTRVDMPILPSSVEPNTIYDFPMEDYLENHNKKIQYI